MKRKLRMLFAAVLDIVQAAIVLGGLLEYPATGIAGLVFVLALYSTTLSWEMWLKVAAQEKPPLPELAVATALFFVAVLKVLVVVPASYDVIFVAGGFALLVIQIYQIWILVSPIRAAISRWWDQRREAEEAEEDEVTEEAEEVAS